jgi:hypothetical protein
LELLCPQAPPELVRVVERMMASDPADRFATMAQLADELQAVRRRHFCQGWSPNADDPEGLRKALSATGLIEEATLAKTSARSRRVTLTGDDAESTPPEDAFELLRLLGRLPAGGLSQFQVEQILTGHIDRLRLPRHIVVDQIGTGWKGDVFKARRTSAPKTVAGESAAVTGRIESLRVVPLKRLRGLSPFDKDRSVQLKRYVERVVRLPPHDLIARRYDAELRGELFVSAGEFIEGGALSAYVTDELRTASASLKRVLQLMSDMCAGLRHLHAAGILHLDLSPDRWIVRPDGRAVLNDWGLVELFMPHSADDRPAGGSPPIVAPEAVDRWHHAAPAADVFALGHVFRFIRSGKFPFRSSRVIDDSKAVGTQSVHSDWITKEQLAESSSKPNREYAETAKLNAPTAAMRHSPDDQLDVLIGQMTVDEPTRRPSLDLVAAKLTELQQELGVIGSWIGWLKRAAVRRRNQE